jgi:2-(1,2-epoxy-1,2-dihydrophenyl)acetyl-CoA isomerase
MSAVEVTREGAAARVTLNRPDSMNAWNEELGVELAAAVKDLGADPEVRAVLITGAGRAFSSGADLRETRQSEDGGLPDLSERLKSIYHPIIVGIREMPKPVIAAVNGPAVGIGCSLALVSDLVVAAESSYFLLAFVNIGLVPDGGSTAALPAKVGYARAAELTMLGEKLPAAKALEWGLINRVYPDDQLEAEAGALLERMANGPTMSYAGAKALLNRQSYADLAGQLDAEAERQGVQGRSADFMEGVLAFLQKRPPKFTGS